MRFATFLAALLLLPSAALAQESPAVLAAKSHVRSLASDQFAPTVDLADLHAAHVEVDARTGATFVQVAQRHAGVEVFGASTPVAVSQDGRVVMAHGALSVESGLAQRANASTPALSAEAAIARAIAHAPTLRPAPERTVFADDPATDAPRERRYEAIGEARLVYQPTDSGALRLAWWLTIDAVAGTDEMWSMRVDAQTGAVLAVDDLVARHTLHRDEHAPAAPVVQLPVQHAPALGALADTYSYRVVPMPFESPNHGAFQLVTSPHNPAASQLGWHDTGTVTYDITRGNNAWAYEDRFNVGSGASAAQTSPNTFDHPFDPSLNPDGNVNAAIVNLFYWGNIFHDVFWNYGFNEAGGNMQVNNFGRGGAGNDPVRLEALDRSSVNPCPAGEQCTNNANFFTPPDGSSGRMQMYRWTAVPQFEVLTPPSVAGQYPSRGGAFGAGLSTTTGDLVFAIGLDSNLGQACSVGEVGNPGDVAGNVMLIKRGSCDFAVKARTAQALGAAAVVIYNCQVSDAGCTGNNPGEGLVTMGCTANTSCADITIPSLFVQASTAATILDVVGDGPTSRITIGQDRDSDFDAGIIAHEYGHGLSNRLVGGPANTSCLGNQEQMGEGWSDYVGLMLTMQAGDTAQQRRGVGTYVSFEPIDGIGIRNAPYSTDFAINNYTYQSVISQGGTGLSIPHGIGFVWATMLWEMTWELIAAHGFDPDVYNAAGMAGNQIALNLVTQGLKLTPCNPGFVTGRDAILAADVLLYPTGTPGIGRHYNQIWTAFARRGLGQGANQGSASNVNDGVASFTLPPLAAETRPDGSTVSLTVTGANPFRTETRLALALDRPQAVRVDVVDLLGRTVATLHDGAVAADTHELRVSAAGLAPGVYLVRATGDGFSLTERITIAR